MYEVPYVICSVHPKAEDFYSIFFSFHRSGDVLDYAYAGGAPGIFMSGVVSNEHFENYRSSFRGNSAKTNIIDFQLASDARFKFPTMTHELPFSQEILNSLLKDIIPELLDDRKLLAEHKLHVIAELQKLAGEHSNVIPFPGYTKPCYPYRLRTRLHPKEMPGFWVQNMNHNGLLLKTTDFSQSLSLDRVYEFEVNHDGKKHLLKAKPVRVQPTGPGRSELGIGLKLIDGNTVLEEILKPTFGSSASIVTSSKAA